MRLRAIQTAQGAAFAPDSIPLHFGDQAAEYRAALDEAVLLDRSHEARLAMAGRTAIDLLHRISTNDLTAIPVGAGRPTVLVNANARILDRIEVFQRGADLLVLGEPGRGNPLRAYLQRNIFFGDDVQLKDLSAEAHQFDLHGPKAGAVIGRTVPEAVSLEVMQGNRAVIAGAEVYIVRRKPVSEQRWTVLTPTEHAAEVWGTLTETGVRPAGSLIYNVLRVRAGLPSIGRELSDQFIPLEVGLWDEVSFTKGCYTGQEIIARMESRNRLAKTIVMLQPAAAVSTPAVIYAEGRQVGQLTSSVTAPDGELFALGVVKPEYAEPGQILEIGDQRINAQVKALPEGSRREIR
jgi:aminomethyltransferase